MTESLICPTCQKNTFDTQKAMRIHHSHAHGESLSGFDKTCGVCGKEFSSMMKETRFCSKECSGQHRSNAYTGKLNPSWNGGEIIISCEFCESDYQVTPALKNKSRFCSIGCKSKFESEAFEGENNPYWRGGWEGYYGPNWQEQREKALERDFYRCRLCNISQKDYSESYGTGLSVHHRTPFRYFEGDFEKANCITNLLTLCQPCHLGIENGWDGTRRNAF